MSTFIDDISTWYLRLSRKRFARNPDATDKAQALVTMQQALSVFARVAAPILPFLAEALYQNLETSTGQTADTAKPDSVHLTRWPTGEFARLRDADLERSMATARRAVDLARTLRAQAGLKTRQPVATLWLALPAGEYFDEILDLIGDEVNAKAVVVLEDGSTMIERRVKPLLPRIGKRLGAAIPAVMAAARDGTFEIHPDGSVTLAGLTLAPDDVEILATPRPGTAVAHDEGLVVVIDTTLTPELRAEGDARELQRAVQDLRKDAELALTDRIELWIDGLAVAVDPFLDPVVAETLADKVERGPTPAGLTSSSVTLDSGTVTIGLRRAVAPAEEVPA